MKIYREESLSGFEFWSGAKDFAKKLTDNEFDQIEDNLTGLYPDGMDETHQTLQERRQKHLYKMV